MTVTENTTTSDRSATITVKGGGITRTVSVKQDKKVQDPYLNVDPSSLTFPPLGGSKDFKISSNISWTITSSQSWCTVNKSSGSNNATITVTVEKRRYNSSAGSATITIEGTTAQGDKITKTVSVTRDKYTLSVSPTSLSFSATSETKSISVTSNDLWTVTSSESWCTVSPSEGSNDGTVKVTVSKNESDSRSATITVKGTNSGITKTVSVKQDEPEGFLGRDDYDDDDNLNNK